MNADKQKFGQWRPKFFFGGVSFLVAYAIVFLVLVADPESDPHADDVGAHHQRRQVLRQHHPFTHGELPTRHFPEINFTLNSK